MAIYQNLSGTTSKSFKIGKYVTLDTTKSISNKTVLSVDKDLSLTKLYFGSDSASFIDSIDYTGNSATTTKLQTPINFSINFDGDTETYSTTIENVDLTSNVDFVISALPAYKLTGDIPLAVIQALIATGGAKSNTSVDDDNIGTEDILARADHKHDGQYLDIDQEINVTGDISFSGKVTEELSATIGDGKVLDKHIDTVSAEKILAGTIGSKGNEVNLVGNASTADKATDSDYAHNLKPAQTYTNSLVYQTGNETKYVGTASENQILTASAEGLPTWVSPENISVNNAATVDVVDAESGPLYFLGIDDNTKTALSPVKIGKKLYYRLTDNALVATKFVGNLTGDVTGNLTGNVTGDVTGNLYGNADTATQATYSTYIGDSKTHGYDYSTLSDKFSDYDTKFSNVVNKVTVGTTEYTPTNNNVTIPNYTPDATKVVKSNTNGNIIINGTETTIYTLPTASTTVRGGVYVDDSFNSNSVNPVQNKVVASSISSITASISTIDTSINTISTSINNITASVSTISTSLNTLTNTVTTHIDDKNNPHNVTKAQIGLDLVENKTMDVEPTKDSTNYVQSGGTYKAINTVSASIATVSEKIENHLVDANNPHKVTKAQVGLGSVENASMQKAWTGTVEDGGFLVDAISDNDTTGNNYISSGLVASTIKSLNTKLSGDQEFTNVKIKGSLTVQGNVTSLETTNTEIKDQLVELDKREDGSALSGLSGIYVKNYDGTDDTTNRVAAIVFDSDGVAYAGHANLDSDGLIDTENDNGLQSLTTIDRSRFTVDRLTKYDVTSKTLVDAIEGSDYLSNTSIIPAENVINTKTGGVLGGGDPDKITISANTITVGNLPYGRIDHIVATKAVSDTDEATKDNGSEDILARADHKHSEYLTATSAIKLGGEVTAEGKLGEEIPVTINDSVITTSKIADSAVTTAKIADANITTDKIADLNVTTEKLNDSAVTTEKINDSAVTTDKIADGNITTEKLNDSAVTTAKIADANITTAKIADGNVTDAKIDTVSPSKINAGTIGSSTKIVNLVGNATTASDLSKAKAKGILYQSAANTTSTLNGSDNQVLLQGSDAPTWTDQKNIVAGSINGGTANAVLYQSEVNKTDFIAAPTDKTKQSTFTIQSGKPEWVKTATLNVNRAVYANTVDVVLDDSNWKYAVGVSIAGNSSQTPNVNSKIKFQDSTVRIGDLNADGEGKVIFTAGNTNHTTTIITNTDVFRATDAKDITVSLPSASGTIDTIEQRNKKLEEYLPLTANKTLTGNLKIKTANAQLILTNSDESSVEKGSRLDTLTYTNDSAAVIETVTSSLNNSSVIYIGGSTASSTVGFDRADITVATTKNSTSRKTVVSANADTISIGKSTTILPAESVNVGTNKNKLVNIYTKEINSDTFIENGTNINKIYANSVSDETGESVPTLTSYGDSASPSTVITGVEIKDGVLEYETGYLPVDDMVQQVPTTENKSIPLILASTTVNDTAGVREQVKYNTGIYANPYEKSVTATTFNGDLHGNADTATDALNIYETGESARKYSGTKVMDAVDEVESATSDATANTIVKRNASNAVTLETVYTKKIQGYNNTTAHLVGLADNATDATYAKNVGVSTAYVAAANVIAATSTVEAATSAASANTLVKRDAQNNFAAGIITAALNGNASTATKLLNKRKITVGANTTSTGSDSVEFDGTSDITIVIGNINPAKIEKGTIGKDGSEVDLVGNAKTATTAKHLMDGAKYSIPIQTAASSTSYISWVDSNTGITSQEYLLMGTKTDEAPKWVENKYLHRDGKTLNGQIETMSGTLTLALNKNKDNLDTSESGLNANYSDIKNVHGIYFGGATGQTNTYADGIHFHNEETDENGNALSVSKVDTVYATGGQLYFYPNRTVGETTEAKGYEVINSNNYIPYNRKMDITEVGVSANVSISNIDINEVGATNSTTKALNVSRGGTGKESFTKNAILVGNSTGALNELKIGTADQYLKVNSKADGYEFDTLGSMIHEDSDKYAGNSNLIVLGNVTTGSWSASQIDLNYIGAGTDNIRDTHSSANREKYHTPVTPSTNGLFVISNGGANAWSSKNITTTITDTVAAYRLNTNASFGKDVSINGNLTVTGQATLGGLTVSGTTTTIDTTTLSIEDTLLELGRGRANVSTAMTGYAGYYVTNFAGTADSTRANKAGALVFDSKGIAYVGHAVMSNGQIDTTVDGTKLQPLATRSLSSTENTMVKWDFVNKTLVDAVPGTDYVPGLGSNETGDKSYYKTEVNGNGLVTGGSETIQFSELSGNINITDNRIVGDLPSTRVAVTLDANNNTTETLAARLNSITSEFTSVNSKIASINDTVTSTGKITVSGGNIAANQAVGLGGTVELTIRDSTITSSMVNSINGDKISGNVAGAATVSMGTLSAKTAYLAAVTSSTAGTNQTPVITGVSVTVGSNTESNLINAIAKYSNKLISATGTLENAVTFDGSAIIHGSSSLNITNASINGKPILTNSNISSYALVGTTTGQTSNMLFRSTALGTEITYSPTYESTTGKYVVDLTGFMPTNNTYDTRYVGLSSTQNIPGTKSFGNGVKLGTDNSTTSYDTGEGCTISYNSTKKCVQFTFA